MKEFFKKIFSLVMVVVLFLTSVTIASKILTPKDGRGENDGFNSYVSTGFKGERKNSIDVFFVGNSDVYRAISPIDIWKQYGYTSYTCGEPLQDMKTAYRRIAQMDKTQSPSLVVLEVDGAFKTVNNTGVNKRSFGKRIKDHINAFKNKFANIEEGLGTAIGFYFPIFKHHSRWDELRAEDFFDMERSQYFATKGFLINKNIEPYVGGMEYMKSSTKEEKMNKQNFKYLNKIIRYCNDNKIQLMFLEVPSASSWNYGKHNTIKRIASENKINFLDMNTKIKEIGFDWKHDTKDAGNHLNIYGAEKVTPYVGDFIAQNYKMTDRRNDPNFEDWHEDEKKFDEIKAGIMKE